MGSGELGDAYVEPQWIDDVLRFWLDVLTPDAWFKRDAAVDDVIKELFGARHARLIAEGLEPFTSREALAAVIVLDQFSRNIYRGDARAFAADRIALSISRAAIARGWDLILNRDQRLFLYLPFEHSESLEDQQQAVTLIGSLGDAKLTEFALAHQRIIKRFGRFPHRNAALGRDSTPEELAFLQEPGSSF